MSNEILDKYWICEECATERGWKSYKIGNTVIEGLCGWCDRADVFLLTSLRDFKNENGVRADVELCK